MANDDVMCPRRAEQAGHPLLEQFPGPDTPVDGRCPYCGSLTGDEFMRRVDAGDQLGPTDKSYKVYFDNPWAKFYFQHLSEDQKHDFIARMNAKTLNVGYPGRFYVLPYFVVTG